MTGLYWYPKFDGIDLHFARIGGPGLGNLLFPWARAVVHQAQYGGRLVWPIWRQVKPLRLLRRDFDQRQYHTYFRPTDTYAVGLERLRALRLLPKTSLELVERNEAKTGLVAVRGMDGLFIGLNGYSELLSRELAAMTAPSFRSVVRDEVLPNQVAIHVRLGDFGAPDTAALLKGKTNTSIPLKWYMDVVNALTKASHSRPHFVVYSDGTDEQLRPLLSITGVQRAKPRAAICDLLCIASSDALIASGSTFSMWGAFIGQVPTIWHKGQMKGRLIDDAHAEFEFDGHVPMSFVASVAARCSARRKPHI